MSEPKFPILFRTLEGGIVTLDCVSEYSFVAGCDPCGASTSSNVESARTWANTHAGQCRAIPQAVQATIPAGGGAT